ncbi:MAG TPA: YHS domain-containing protein [Gemmatimonadaceae bacterium]|nr:YHS domain-containing protein [Gemmatimonadaceae bacterium]
MTTTRDLVCGMMVDPETAPARASFQGTTYYFCTVECRDQFESNPARYTARVSADARGDDLEKHEAPFTKKGQIVAPKFGSAGSGGLEFEPGPERHKGH